MKTTSATIMLALAAAVATPAQALEIVNLSPQGEVAQVRQVMARFDAAAVNFGDSQAPAPLQVKCSDEAVAQGTGRWSSEREWLFDFSADLPIGVRCDIVADPGFAGLDGKPLQGQTSFSFSTGGPAVLNMYPNTWQQVDEDQIFLLRLNGEADLKSVQQHVWCESEALGERIGVRLVEGDSRRAILGYRGMTKAAEKEPNAFITLACQRRLPAATEMRLVFGEGVLSARGAMPNRIEKPFVYTVRAPFAANFTCERENAQAACMPIRDMVLMFNAPLSWAQARQIRLKPQGGAAAIAPRSTYENDDGTLRDDSQVHGVRFAAPLPASTQFTIELPPGLVDSSGRALDNAGSFPLKVATDAMPPLVKFAAAPFGIVERFAEKDGVPPLLPLTLRKVEVDLPLKALRIDTHQPKSDAEIIQWLRRLDYYGDYRTVPRHQALEDAAGPVPPGSVELEWDDGEVSGTRLDEDEVESRMVPLLHGRSDTKRLEVPAPQAGDPRPFEVIGIPMEPGFQVLEVASQMLGERLLSGEYDGSHMMMYVRTSALVTNLAVHFKLGREDSLVWVTSLDDGRVVEGASVRVSDCHGRELATARTGADGTARIEGLSPRAPYCYSGNGLAYWGEGYFVSARAIGRDGAEELAFVWSNSSDGIEPWRFNVNTSMEVEPDRVAHTVLDRTLLRAGETVSMKHYIRNLMAHGFANPQELPRRLHITHVGSGQEYSQDLEWSATSGGGVSAQSTFSVPPRARLGEYRLRMEYDGDDDRGYRDEYTGSFRVEEFRLPVFEGRIAALGDDALVRASAVDLGVQLNFISGGPAGNLPVRVTAAVEPYQWHSVRYTLLWSEKAGGVISLCRLCNAKYEGFSFDPPRAPAGGDDGVSSSGNRLHMIADEVPLMLDAAGSARMTLNDVPVRNTAQTLRLQATYADPNGEIQSISSTAMLWPAHVQVGIKAESWITSGRRLPLKVVVLDLQGQPVAGAQASVRAVQRITRTSRKRMTGGYYVYDNRQEQRDEGALCEGQSDDHGLLECQVALRPGQVELIAQAQDQAGNVMEAATTVWVMRNAELWFGGENHDRIDVLPEKKDYEPGETAVFQVRMPFRHATALVAVEREGVLHTQLVELEGRNPVIRLKVEEGWSPNVYVSVLALRGRLRHVPWYSFFEWGYQDPVNWWNTWRSERGYTAPTALVDLSKPAFRFGMGHITVGARAHRLDVAVAADRSEYQIRETARIHIRATLPDGEPAANASVALAAVDQALLELWPNRSWNLLDAMLAKRAWGVRTATAQMQVIGRRHYGRKAVPAGGDGAGGMQARELFDTLLLWEPDIRLDEKGEATVDVPLNDAITSFRIVAVADLGADRFGTGETRIRATQDLQIISGLPPLVRDGDHFTARMTLRNATAQAMRVQVQATATGVEALGPRTLDIGAGQAAQALWEVSAPQMADSAQPQKLQWDVQARDTLGTAADRLKVSQNVVPAVPLTVQQATLVQLEGEYSLPVQLPPAALPGRGGIRLALQPKLAEGLQGVRDWFALYPFNCFEQLASVAVGLRDAGRWQVLMNKLPDYMDEDGLLYYYPPRSGVSRRGSDTLAAYLLAMSHEASALEPELVIPDAELEKIQSGLTAFVQGRIQRKFWSPRADDLDVRKIAAIEALSRYGKAGPELLESVTITPNQWPTHAVIDWYNILQRVHGVPQRDEKLREAQSILRARLSFQGTRAIFSTEQDDYWWWLMQNGDVNTARLLLAVMDNAQWRDDMGRLANGFIRRQQDGAWHTTTANLWGSLALEKFSRKFESEPVSGITRATLGDGRAQVEWSKVRRLTTADAQGAAHQRTWFGAPASAEMLTGNSMMLPLPSPAQAQTLMVEQDGTGKPWMTIQSIAAVPRTQPVSAGYTITRTTEPLQQAQPGQYTRGDVLRIRLEVDASADMTWVVISDPVPGGATILGSGLGRDSAIAASTEQREGRGWLAYEERGFEYFRAHYEYLPKGKVTLEYTIRLNNEGEFALPVTRVEALYAPEMFGEAPNAAITVRAAP